MLQASILARSAGITLPNPSNRRVDGRREVGSWRNWRGCGVAGRFCGFLPSDRAWLDRQGGGRRSLRLGVVCCCDSSFTMPTALVAGVAAMALVAGAVRIEGAGASEQVWRGFGGANSWHGMRVEGCSLRAQTAVSLRTGYGVKRLVCLDGREPREVERVVRAKGVSVESAAVTDEPDLSLGKEVERDYAGTPSIPIYVMLPLSTVNENNEVSNAEGLKRDLEALKSVNVDGVMVDCWWGLVEGKAPQVYNWAGYMHLFNIVRDAGLKLQVVMSFHQCGGNVGDDVNISIPQWVLDIGEKNPDIFFTERNGARNPECLTWGIDKERVLSGRTGLEVYYDYMRSFRQAFDDFFNDGTITEIEIGLGACGELRYPSYPERLGWQYPGIGEFQCYDKYFLQSLTKAAERRGHPNWGHPPENAGNYNSQPQDTEFFRDGGDYDSYYGRFFLKWYSRVLIDHGNSVLTLANLAFEDMKIAAKVSGIHWWYKTASHAAELGAGFYNTAHRDGYLPIAQMLAKHNAAFNFTCVELTTLAQEDSYPEALADPEGLVWQVLNAAWDSNIAVASENALPCYDRDGYNKILENAKPRKNPDGRHLVAFTYLRLNPTLMERSNLDEFARFVTRLHGEGTEN